MKRTDVGVADASSLAGLAWWSVGTWEGFWAFFAMRIPRFLWRQAKAGHEASHAARMQSSCKGVASAGLKQAKQAEQAEQAVKLENSSLDFATARTPPLTNLVMGTGMEYNHSAHGLMSHITHGNQDVGCGFIEFTGFIIEFTGFTGLTGFTHPHWLVSPSPSQQRARISDRHPDLPLLSSVVICCHLLCPTTWSHPPGITPSFSSSAFQAIVPRGKGGLLVLRQKRTARRKSEHSMIF